MSRVTAVVLALAVVAAPAAAYAKKDRTAGRADAAEGAPSDDADDAGRLVLSGRVFARESFESRETAAWTSEARLASARLAAKLRWKKRLRAP